MRAKLPLSGDGQSARGWAVIAVWAALAGGGLLAHERIGEVTAAGQNSFLPADSEASRAMEALRIGSPGAAGGGELLPAVLVFERRGGLSGADVRAIGRLGEGIDRLELRGATPALDPFDGADSGELRELTRIADGIGPISRDGEAALIVIGLDASDRGAITSGVARIRHYLSEHERPGLAAYVTGPAGIAADLEQVADEAGRTLLFATLGLVLVLLLAVYRAPVLAVLPLLCVGAAYLVAIAIAYLLIEADLITANAEGTMLLLVLVFGAGTDYSLLLVHRYRERLAGGAPRGSGRGPLTAAVAETTPTLVASAGTVIAAMLALLVADLESTRWLGPILAIGIAAMLLAALTLLPALLAALGPRAFWPARPAAPTHEVAIDGDIGRRLQPRDVWGRVARVVRRRSGRIVVGVFAVLGVLALGNLTSHGTLGFGQGVTRATDSSRGTAALERHFPPGLGSPLTAVVRPREAERAARQLERLAPVKIAVPAPAPQLERALVVLLLRGSPYSNEATEAVAAIRERLHEVAPGGLLGGIPAENYEVESTNSRDTKLILPLILLVVGAILCALLRALLAPAYIIATVVASFAATLGLVTFGFAELLGADGIAFNLTLMAFLFLVALGVDYNIFLMARARREAAARGTREGMLAALRDTGGVVTGAGLILAGTFATLVLLPLEELVQIGATVALGVLLDTFVVRALLVPAITYRLGDRAWLPSRR